jgi:molybdate transport repressor ModE-like protein
LSYRRAWNLLDDLNRSFAQTVLSTAVGGVQGGGARLTDFGLALVKAFRALEDAALPLARAHLRKFSATARKRRSVERPPAGDRPSARRKPLASSIASGQQIAGGEFEL